MLRNLRNTWRNIRKQRVTSIINVTGLGIGLAAAVMIFLWVQNELNYDNYHADKERIYRITSYLTVTKGDTWIWETSPLLLAEEMRSQIPEIEQATRVLPLGWGMALKLGHQQFWEKGCAFVDESWFKCFNYQFLQGNATAFNKNPYSLILTEAKAKQFFGNSDVIGKTMRIDSVNYTVQAVVRNNRVNSSFQFEVLIPLASRLTNPVQAQNEKAWGNFNYMTFIKIAPTANKNTVLSKAQALIQKHRDNENLKLGLMPLTQMHFDSELQASSLQRGNRNTVYVFTVLGFLILLIACINYVNLTTARASLRIKEVSIKKIVGAERRHLMMQFIGESALMSLLSLILGLLLVIILLPAFNRLTEKEFILDFSAPILWYILGGALGATILLTSIYPAILLSSFRPVEIFRGRGFLKVKDSVLRKGLVVMQFTFSIALIIGVLVVAKQLNYMQKQGNGYARSQIMSFTITWQLIQDDEKRKTIMSTMKQSLVAQSSIEEVSLINQASVQDMQGLTSGSADWEGRDPEFRPSIAHFAVDDDFPKIVPLEVVKGKWFSPGPQGDAKNVLVNETAVKELKLREPVIGQRFMAWGDTGVVIGVVKDFHYRSMHDKIGPLVIKKSNRWLQTFLVKTGRGQLTAATKAAEKIWKEYFPDDPITYNFLDEEFDKIYKSDRKASMLVSVFATITIIISCLGLFGLAAFTAERRTKEIGIRKVLGAGVAGIVQLLSREFVLLVVIAFVLASPIAWYAMNAWLQDFAYRVDISWWIFAIAAISSIAIALLTVCFQAIKVALRNPVQAIRSE